MTAPVLDDVRLRRYARQILLPEIGGRGQRALLAATVQVSLEDLAAAQVALAYLAGAGIGTLVLRDAPAVVIAAHVGFLLEPADEGAPVVEALRRRIAERAPDTSVRAADEQGDEPGPVLLRGPIEESIEGAVDEPDEWPAAPPLVAALWRGGQAAAKVLLELCQAAQVRRTP